ncbi:alpha/beta hydrolase family protein [Demequina sp. TTPB684]|uniref:alpha/beta hydrolase n=1 Tax=unclassified Demequina TaxID=2620311 RepID=UPI001CF5A0FD|nr:MULTISPECIES: alpha/beta hydrolase [unclassified Demequina]MCB2412228.1 alpha/beta hydrolase family protein [Demequina sp. TTPB684]UPU87790.1 alpha/beta hydrolase family protein [Demequina sp. TMPB413]
MTALVSVHDVPDLPVQPDAVRGAADELRQAATELDGAANSLEGTWAGVPAVLSSAQTAPLMDRMALATSAVTEARDGIKRAAFALGDLADSLAWAKARIESLECEVPDLRRQVFTARQSMAEQWGMPVSDMDDAWGPGQFEANGRLWAECLSVGDLIETATSDCVGALQRIGDPDALMLHAMSAFRHPSPGPRSAVAQADFEAAVMMSFLRQLAASEDADAILAWLEEHPDLAELLWLFPPPADQVEVWWSNLDPDATRSLIEHAPRMVGNLDGVILADRIEANRYGVQDEIATIDARVADLRQQLADIPTDREHAYNYQARRQRIAEEEARADYYRSLIAVPPAFEMSGGVPRQVAGTQIVVFDPAHEAIATYHGWVDPVTGGMPDWVEHVVVSVPGTGSSVMGFADARAGDIYVAASDENEPTAVFQWCGGEMPGDIPEAIDSSYSHALAPRLARFTNAIELPVGADVTAVGHSYGAATLGLAEQAGLRADKVVYVAPAGLGDGVTGLRDFPHTGDAPHFSMMVRNDKVVGLIQHPEQDFFAPHGPSPLVTPGVVRLETGQVDASDPTSTDLEDYWKGGNPPHFAGHSALLDPGSTAFTNVIGVVVNGEVELYRPDDVHVVLPGDRVLATHGNDRDDIDARYMTVSP